MITPKVLKGNVTLIISKPTLLEIVRAAKLLNEDLKVYSISDTYKGIEIVYLGEENEYL